MIAGAACVCQVRGTPAGPQLPVGLSRVLPQKVPFEAAPPHPTLLESDEPVGSSGLGVVTWLFSWCTGECGLGKEKARRVSWNYPWPFGHRRERDCAPLQADGDSDRDPRRESVQQSRQAGEHTGMRAASGSRSPKRGSLKPRIKTRHLLGSFCLMALN